MVKLPCIICTENLKLRQVNESDAEAIHLEIMRSYATLEPWVEWLNAEPTIEDSITFLQHAHCDFKCGKSATMGIWVKDTNQLAGIISAREVKWTIPSAEIGYWGSIATAGKGYISEALRALSAYFMEDLAFTRLWLACDANNNASIRVAEHSGFEFEARLRNARRTSQGDLTDSLIYTQLHT